MYPTFTINRLKRQFGLTFVESAQTVIQPATDIRASEYLQQAMERNLDLALGIGTEKARSELIIAPILVEVREFYQRQVSLFSGREFNINEDEGLTGYCDFLISRSPELLEVTAPVMVIVEAKKDSLNSGIPQCIASMVAAQQFNQSQENKVETVYGAVTTGKLWKFVALSQNKVSIDLNEYAIPPLETVLAFLTAMVGS